MSQRYWLILLFLFLPGLALSQRLKTYHGETTQQIVDNDVVYARDIAFAELRRTLIYQASLDLLGRAMYDMYRSSEFTHGKLGGSQFLNSVKVLKEERKGSDFFMSITGEVAANDLAHKLRQMNLVLKQDPWQKVTVLAESPLMVPAPELKERLGIFHLKLQSIHSASLPPFEERDQPKAIESIFKNHPKATVLLVIETRKSDKDEPSSIGLRVYRKSGFRQLGSYTMPVGVVDESDWADVLNEHRSGFLALFSLTSIQQTSFSEGEQSMVHVDVTGLDTPFLRDQFEAHILKQMGGIRHFGLVSLSQQGCRYQVQLRRGLESLVAHLKQTNPYFYFQVISVSGGQIKVNAASKQGRRRSEPKPFEADEDMFTEISSMLSQDPGSVPPNEWLPHFSESEPNDNSQQVNRLARKTLIYGRISSRADKDIFELHPVKGAKSLTITWGRVGQTSLSPQLKLYDHQFGYLNQYNLTGIKQTMVRYQFQEPPESNIFLRVADRVGFIQGETGGFKSYQYLISYHWDP